MWAWIYVYMPCECKYPWKLEQGTRLLGLKFQTVLSHSVLVLGRKLGSSLRATRALNHWIMSPDHNFLYLNWLIKFYHEYSLIIKLFYSNVSVQSLSINYGLIRWCILLYPRKISCICLIYSISSFITFCSFVRRCWKYMYLEEVSLLKT